MISQISSQRALSSNRSRVFLAPLEGERKPLKLKTFAKITLTLMDLEKSKQQGEGTGLSPERITLPLNAESRTSGVSSGEAEVLGDLDSDQDSSDSRPPKARSLFTVAMVVIDFVKSVGRKNASLKEGGNPNEKSVALAKKNGRGRKRGAFKKRTLMVTPSFDVFDENTGGREAPTGKKTGEEKIRSVVRNIPRIASEADCSAFPEWLQTCSFVVKDLLDPIGEVKKAAIVSTRSEEAGVASGSTDSFILQWKDGNTVKRYAVIKPFKGLDNYPKEELRKGVQAEDMPIREAIAPIVGKRFGHLPETTLVDIPENVLTKKARSTSGEGETTSTICTISSFAEGSRPLSSITERNRSVFLDTISVEEKHSFALLQILLGNLDCNSGNVLVQRDEENQLRLISIDHSLSLSKGFEDQAKFTWIKWNGMDQGLSADLLRRIEELDWNEVKGDLEAQGINLDQETLQTICTTVHYVKTFASIEGISPYQMGCLMYTGSLEKAQIFTYNRPDNLLKLSYQEALRMDGPFESNIQRVLQGYRSKYEFSIRYLLERSLDSRQALFRRHSLKQAPFTRAFLNTINSVKQEGDFEKLIKKSINKIDRKQRVSSLLSFKHKDNSKSASHSQGKAKLEKPVGGSFCVGQSEMKLKRERGRKLIQTSTM